METLFSPFVLFAVLLVLPVHCRSMVSRVSMNGVRVIVRFTSSGSNVIGNLDAGFSGLDGMVQMQVRPLWVYYDVEDKCNTTQLGNTIGGITATISVPATTSFTLPSTSLDYLESKSLVLIIGGMNEYCGTIQQEGDYITAVAHFRNKVSGTVYFRQFSSGTSRTFISTDLTTAEQFSKGSWKVAKDKVKCGSIIPENQLQVFELGNSSQSCAAGDLTCKFGNVSISTNQVTQREAYSDANLPIRGVSNNLSGKYLLIYDPANPQVPACAQIRVFGTRVATVSFSQEGVEGTFKFSQSSPFDPTDVHMELRGLDNKAKSYHVHKRPVPMQTKKDQPLCANDIVSGHFNPYSISTTVNYPAPLASTEDMYEVGDLSSKYGTVAGVSDFGPKNVSDWNLPLFGKNSIIGRSIVIHKDVSASRWICSTIEIEPIGHIAAAIFTYPVIGHVYFTQGLDMPQADTWIFSRLSYIDGRTSSTGHKWQVNENKVNRDMMSSGNRCASTGSMYNPTNLWDGVANATYDAMCRNDTNQCKTGDLSGKFGTIDIGSTGISDMFAESYFTDMDLPLTIPDSIVGKSLVIKDISGSEILACTTIQMLHSVKLSADFKNGPITGSVDFEQRAGFGQAPTRVTTVPLDGFKSDSHRLEIRTSPPSMSGNVCSGIGSIYNPLDVDVQSGKSHQVGNLSRRMGKSEWLDFNIPLTGKTSINGRSLAVLDGSSNVLACAPIGFRFHGVEKYHLLKANLDFTGPVMGHIQLSQLLYNDGTLSDTTITVDLKNSNNAKTPNHNWHVHQNPVQGDSRAATGTCSSAGPHFDPFMAKIGNASTDYSQECGGLNPLRCEVGDQAMKLGTYSLGSGVQVLTDVFLPLEGKLSVQGRSIVVHVQNKGAPRQACADIIPADVMFITTELKIQQNFDKRAAAMAYANAINTEVYNIVVEYLSHSDENTKIKIHFIGENKTLLKVKFISFLTKEVNRKSLNEYSPLSDSGKAGFLSLSVILLTLITGRLLA